jgi:hypothetical protein
VAKKALEMGYLTCESDGNLGLWMCFCFLWSSGANSVFMEQVEKVKELVVDYLHSKAE